LIEGLCPEEHPGHLTDVRSVPTVEWFIERDLILERRRHIKDVGRVPTVDRISVREVVVRDVIVYVLLELCCRRVKRQWYAHRTTTTPFESRRRHHGWSFTRTDTK
jgi:hypothetical protein